MEEDRTLNEGQLQSRESAEEDKTKRVRRENEEKLEIHSARMASWASLSEKDKDDIVRQEREQLDKTHEKMILGRRDCGENEVNIERRMYTES